MVVGEVDQLEEEEVPSVEVVPLMEVVPLVGGGGVMGGAPARGIWLYVPQCVFILPGYGTPG